MRNRAPIVAALLVLLGFALHVSKPLLSCPESCLPDYVKMYGGEVGNFALPDARLNAWILGWVQRAGLQQPSRLFDTNAFHPARNTLAGSEHMIGNALLLLPVRIFSDSAIALYQLGIAVSFLATGWAVFALVYWVVGSAWPALLAGVAAMYMPWRYTEVSHLQLLSAQWIPLIWLFCARLLSGESTRRNAVLLSALFALQMLTSFYLAYFTLYSTACLAAGVAWREKPPLRAWRRLATALCLPTAALIALSIPYLDRYTGFRFATGEIPPSTPPEIALAFLAPTPSLLADSERLIGATYYIPLVVFALAFIPLIRRLSFLRASDDVDRRIGTVGLGLICAIVGAFVLMLGRRLAIGDIDVPILGSLLAQILPGFSQMRAEFRWGIVIGLAFPVLAGIGAAVLERSVASSSKRRFAVNLGVAVLLLVNTPLFRIPVKPAWLASDGIETAHDMLKTLEPGPVLHLPWGLSDLHMASFGSRYMLASSFHWYPLLNGYTAYPPESHRYLRRIALSLPEPEAVVRLQQLTGLRWIVLHPQRFANWRIRYWDTAVKNGTLVRVHADAEMHLYRVPDRDDAGSLQWAFDDPTPRNSTLGGVSRAPLDFAAATGQLEVRCPDRLLFEHGVGRPTGATVRLQNESEQTWPGFDTQPGGRVELRFRFFADGLEQHSGTSPLDVDVPAHGSVRTQTVVQPPALPGRFRLVFDLVQRVGKELHPLAVAPVSQPVEVGAGKSPSSRMRAELEERRVDPTRSGRDSETPE